MKRPFTQTSIEADDNLAPSGIISNSDFNDRASYADTYNNTNQSESDCLSDSSQRLRKKRNAYQKISDDIRVQLLEAVQNGETLKAAAKRHRINYSSAKSILHTYRKEGRILKKSAQERTTKKKPQSTPSENRPVSTKTSKSSKKETSELDENTYKVTKKVKTETLTVTGNTEEIQPLGQVNKNRANIQKDTSIGTQDNEKVLPLIPIPNHPVPASKNEELQAKLFGTDTDGAPETNFLASMNSRASSRKGSMQQFRLFDGFQMGYNDMTMPDFPFNYNDGHEFLSFRRFSNDFASFGDIMSAFQAKSGQNGEEAVHEGNNTKGPQAGDEKPNGEVKNLLDYDEQPEGSGNYPLKSFMDTQRMFHNALRKASFLSFGSNAGFRKGSFDFI